MGQIKKAVLQAKEVHDKYYNSLDWLNKKITGVMRTNEVPYYQRFVPSIGNIDVICSKKAKLAVFSMLINFLV